MQIKKLSLGKTGKIISKVFLVNILIVAIGLLTNIVIARFFGKENFGIYMYFFSITNLIYIFASFGLANTFAKFNLNELTKTLLKKVISLLVLSSFIFSVAIYFFGEYLNLNPNIKLFFWLVLLYSFGVSLFNILGGSLRCLEKFKLAIKFSLYNRIILILLILFAILLRNFWFVLLAMSIAIISLSIYEFSKIKFGVKNISIKKLLLITFPFFLALINMHSMYHIDRISINYVLDFAQLGYFSAYSNFINILRIGAFTIPFVMITKSSRQKYMPFKSIKKLLILLLPIALLIGLITPFIVPFLYGSEFVDINYYLIWSMVVSSALLVIYSLINSIFLGEHTSNKTTNIILGFDAFLSICVNLILNVILISNFGLIGAPVATAIVLLGKIFLNLFGLKFSRSRQDLIT
ncbi:oligosaccharide flippase family protein [Candidatus Woesearchaeota archaeon]|jgi:O-antigen/teichoic acid export membrane protein|nr:oligosaccharide flippase family protein [Candidatus Woesearchaeota archaeon]MBT7062438.1 oligosaccharide flippase family protein [Candidatus Woesearchaeota archaeon]MBT7402836.1 oligosaccharide flippase family protein [Candidatus Woesearchaeota archaeon]